ncbi:MAG: HAD hydrolase-like protein, partial [Halanaerobiales bacterium]|nr:HAD hydrolase-like protein [Halanaerobiales bacterium]
MIKNVLFDLDGVLIDAKKWHYQALNEALRTITDYVIPYEEHLRIFDGSPSHVKLHILTERGILKREDHNKILILKQHNTMNLIK